MGTLLAAFQTFFREHSEHWVQRFQYQEAGPQLLLQAFLQRIINSGGRIEREYGLGRMRTDLLIVWPLAAAQELPGAVSRVAEVRKTVIECKLLHGSLAQTPVTDWSRPAPNGPLRRGRGPPRDLRPQRRPVVGREDIPAHGNGRRASGNHLGHVSVTISRSHRPV